MASSSSSCPLCRYDVFLSFRGKDTRYNFVSHLAKDLQNKKIQRFIDDDLVRGDEISPALIRAIEESKISIIIFSKNYADSSWCLEELVKILECRKKLNQIVIPVFYKVEPTDVRKQTGEFGSAFDRLVENIRLSQFFTKEQIWRNALKRAANLSGFHSFNNGSEATLIDNIIVDVLKKLKIGSNNACDDRGLVGINSRKEKIMGLLNTGSPEIHMVGIWGMGGIGKTTIAGVVFNQMSLEFESSCFLANVREKEKTDGLSTMRNNLLSKLLDEKKLEIDTPRIGDAILKKRLSRTKVLVVLDDVDNSLQLEKLIGEHGTNQFGPGSRVLITTRNKHVLEAHDITCVYDMQMLDDRDALELFSFHALRQNQPSELYRRISEEFVKYAKGVPLALKLLGSSLRGKVSIGHWRGELKKLKRIPNKEISEVLKISYDSLSEEEKDIFLDISCFFKGEDVNKIRNVLDGCYVSLNAAMEVLKDKSLINITPRDIWIWDKAISVSIDVVEMHDLVEEMGWNIVIGESKEVGSRSRIWRFEDALDVLTNNKGTDKIKAIVFIGNGVKMNLDPQTFAKMPNLKLLRIEDYFKGIQFPDGLASLPEGLRYLYWHKCPLESLPPTFNPTNLVELHLPCSRLKRLWRRKQDLSNLKGLDLKFCKYIENPDLSKAVNLEELTLPYHCLPIGHLNSLKYLDLFMCNYPKILSSLQQMTNLTHLNLESCTDLMNISSSIQYLTNLKYLNLRNCYNLSEISESIKHLKNLTYLDLLNCTSLRKIPRSIKHLKNLTHLDLTCCNSLNEIPSSIQDLNSLTRLKMGGCKKITKLPNFPQNIKFLEVDAIFIEIDHPFRLLTNLVELELRNCTIEQRSSIFLEQIKLLIPRGCKIIGRDQFGSMVIPRGLQL